VIVSRNQERLKDLCLILCQSGKKAKKKKRRKQDSATGQVSYGIALCIRKNFSNNSNSEKRYTTAFHTNLPDFMLRHTIM
jgi:hypothetical protein